MQLVELCQTNLYVTFNEIDARIMRQRGLDIVRWL